MIFPFQFRREFHYSLQSFKCTFELKMIGISFLTKKKRVLKGMELEGVSIF